MNEKYCEHCGMRNGETVEQSQQRKRWVNLAPNPLASVVVSVRLTDDGWLCQWCVSHTDHSKCFDATTGRNVGW